MVRTMTKVVAVTAVVGAMLTGCGDDDEPEDTATSAAPSASAPSAAATSAAPTGEPITVMTVYPDQSQSANYPGVAATAKSFEEAVNARGGINGRPLRVLTCNDKNDGTQAATCARQAVSEKAVAVAGSFSVGAGQMLPILKAANIPSLAGYALDPADYSSPNSFPVLGGPITFLAAGVLAGQDPACKTTKVINYDVAAAAGLLPFVEQGLKGAGSSLAGTVKVPVTTTDFSSTVAAAKDADCIVSSIPDQFIQAYLAKAQTLGIKQKVYAPGGSLSTKTIKDFAAQLEGSAIASSYAAPSDPVWDGFREATDGKSEVNQEQLQELNTWAAYTILEAVAKTVTGELTAASLTAALNKADAVDTGGLTPPLDFTNAFPLPPLARITDTKLLALRVTGGEVKPEGDFKDYASFFGAS